MIVAVIILLIGLLLVYTEFFLPGGVVGITGLIFIIGGLTWLALDIRSPIIVTVFFIATCIVGFLIIQLALWQIKQRGVKNNIYLKEEQEASVTSYSKDLIGRQGVTITDLNPSGYVAIGGDSVAALSKSDFIHKGVLVQVISIEEGKVVVIQKEYI